MSSSCSLSFDDFQAQASLMTSCTLLWKELSDHFVSLERDLVRKSDELKEKMKILDRDAEESMGLFENREVTIEINVRREIGNVGDRKKAALMALGKADGDGEVDDGDGLLWKLKGFCLKMDSNGFWKFITPRKKELDSLRVQTPVALSECIDPPRFALDAISEVFPVDKRAEKSERASDMGWACVLVLESLIPLVVDPLLGKSRLLVTPTMRERAREVAERWKKSWGVENERTPDVHTFLQHLVTFGIFKEEDLDLYRNLVLGSAWRKQMPKLAVAVGLEDKMPDMIEELIGKGKQIDAVHFTYEAKLANKFPPVPLLRAFLSTNVDSRKEQSSLKAVIRCIEEYRLESEFPCENLKKRLEELEKKRPAAAANKRTRASSGGPMPPAKAGRSTSAYVSSSPTGYLPPLMRSPPQAHYSGCGGGGGGGGGVFPQPPPALYGFGRRSPAASPTYVYSPEAAAAAASPVFAVCSPVSYSAYPPGYGVLHSPPAYYH